MKNNAAIYIKSINHNSMSALGGDSSSRWLTVMMGAVGGPSSGAGVSVIAPMRHNKSSSSLSTAIGLVGADNDILSSIGDVDFKCIVGKVG